MQQLKTCRFNRLAGAVVMGLVALSVVAQVSYAASPAKAGDTRQSSQAKGKGAALQSGRPRLLLSIIVDQLRTDYLEYLRPLMGEGGLKMLMDNGVYIRDVDFPVSGLDAVSGTALLYTGAWPSVNGVTGSSVYSADELRCVPALYSRQEGYNASNLRLSTISDEVMIDGAGLSLVYAVAADPQQSVAMAGHAATGAIYLDSEKGRWTLAPAYPRNQQAEMMLSRRGALSSRIDTMQWKPLLADLNQYPGIPAQKRQYPFRHTFPSRAHDVYRMFSASARANEEITAVATDCLRSLALGKRDAIDMLSVAYTAAPFKYVKDGDYRLELEDTYLRLDRDIARLLKTARECVGQDNLVVMVSSTGYYDDATPDDPKYRIPSGDFSVRRAVSLLNSFYSARYGNADYVAGFNKGRFHLNRRLLEQKAIPLEEAASAGKEFLEKMSGVAQAWTTAEVTSSPLEELQALRRATDAVSGGDILVELTPGWNLVDDTALPQTVTPVRLSATMTPAIFFAPSLQGKVIAAPVEARALAPSITGILRIRAPNGSSAKAFADF